jgi:hypothetical protein
MGMIAAVAASARRTFIGRIEILQRSLEEARMASDERTNLPPPVPALARRLGVPARSRVFVRKPSRQSPGDVLRGYSGAAASVESRGSAW